MRLRGHVSLSPDSPRFGTPTLRFNHAQNVQLLRARTHAGGIVHARVNLVKAAGDGVAHATVTVAVGTKEFAVRELPGAFEGDLYDFTIWPGGNEPPVSGRRASRASPPRATSSSTTSWSPSSSASASGAC